MQDWNNIIIFDGVCNLCSNAVQFIVARDKNCLFRFTSLQSKVGQSILQDLETDFVRADTLFLVKNNRLLTRSEAVLEIIHGFSPIWRILLIGKLIPPLFRDKLYDLVARNRYRWFGKREHCFLPSKELEKRFLH